MKKLKFLAGGQPFRSTDFEVMQNATIASFRQLFNGITSVITILSGAEYDPLIVRTAGTPFTVPEGFIYDLAEICRVPSASFNYDATKALYLRRSESETESRISGSFNNNVMVEVLYSLVYSATHTSGDILLSGIPRLKVLTDKDYTLTQDGTFTALGSGFTAQGGYSGIYCFSNSANERMILCTFSATSSSGTLATLPVKMRPPFNIYGWFEAGTTLQQLVIRSTGEVNVTGAVTSLGTNIVMFRYNVGMTLTL